MEDSPYRSPQVDVFTNPPTGNDDNREKTRSVAKYQRWIIFALLANIAANISAFSPLMKSPILLIPLYAAFLVILVFSILAMFRLANELYGTGTAVVCAILMFMPCISLIVLLVVNQKATGYLQQRGVKVGFLGTDPNSI